MAVKESVYRIDSFSKGIHQEIDYSQYKPGIASNMNNCEIADGNLSLMKGHSIYLSSSISPIALMTYYQNNTAILLGVANGHLYKWTGSAWTDLGGGLDTSATIYDYVNDNVNSADVLIFTNGVDPVKIYEGGATFRNLMNRRKLDNGTFIEYINGVETPRATQAELTQLAPKGKALAVHYERLWVCDDNNLYASTADVAGFDPEDFTTPTDETEVNMHGFEMFLYTGDGSKVVSMDTVFDDLIIWKEKSMHKIFGSDPSNYQKINFAAKGGISDKSVGVHESGAYFIDTSGLFFYDGTNINLISQPIKKLWQQFNEDALRKAVGYVKGNRYILSIADVIIEYDIDSKAFMVGTGSLIKSVTSFSNKVLFCNGSNTIYDYRSADVTLTRDNTVLNAYWENGFADLQIPNATKEVNSVYFTGFGAGMVRITISTEKGIKYKEVLLDSQEKVYNLNLNHRGKLLKIKIENINGVNFTIKNFTVFYELDVD